MLQCFVFQSMQALEQICETGVIKFRSNSYNFCEFSYLTIINENETVTTSTNRQSKEDVQMIIYRTQNVIKFIPNSIFRDFPNVEYFYFNNNLQLEKLKPKFFRNAKNLKILIIQNNPIHELKANLFVDAPKLKMINLSFNKIQTIDYQTFNKLPKLYELYLTGNPIKNLHPQTFSSLKGLEVLDLKNSEGTSCVNENFSIFDDGFESVEKEIGKECESEGPHVRMV